MEYNFKFIDLFAGIGGFHYGLAQCGGQCVMASEIDEIPSKTYFKNYGIQPHGDICTLDTNDIPDFDVLCAGFPCQSFSNIGNKEGLNDPRGALIYEVIRILKDCKPKAFIIENVKGLLTHNKGKTFAMIKDQLINCGYDIWFQVLEAKDYGLPQIRKRLFIVGIDKEYKIDFEFPSPIDCNILLSDILGGETIRKYAFTVRVGGRRSGINNQFNWDAYYVNGQVKYLEPEDCLELQGFPRYFCLEGNKIQKFKQVGNSVPTNIIKYLGNELVKSGLFNKRATSIGLTPVK